MKLVFIHGSGMSRVVWQEQLRYFEDALAIDLPGHPVGELLGSIDELVDQICATLDEVTEDVVVVGHSLGGAIALRLALKPLKNLKGIVLIGSGARLRVMPMILQALSSSAKADNTIPPMMFSMNDKIDEPLRSLVSGTMKANGATVMLNDLSICDSFDMMDEIGKLDLPVLALVGDQDQMTPPKYAEFMVKSIPSAKMEVIEDGTHMVFAEQAEIVNRKIEVFVKSLGEK